MAWVKCIGALVVITSLLLLSQCAYGQHSVEMRFGPLASQEIWMVRYWDDMDTCRQVRETILESANMIADPKYYVTCTLE